MSIRPERKEDFKVVQEVIQLAFEAEEMSDHQEHILVERLRQTEDFIAELSLVYEIDQKIVGYILFSKINIVENKEAIESLALAPVAVLPEYQHRGIGSKLIEIGHKQALQLGFTSVVVLGHADYYPKFGYQKASNFGIRLPFDVPDENCMAIELKENALHYCSGVVQYPKAFSL